MKDILFNENWCFHRQGRIHREIVNLPHGLTLEPLDVCMNMQGIFEYRKTFIPPQIYPHQRIFLHFDGVMTHSRVYINNCLTMDHEGGYLPFITDITDYLFPHRENSVYVWVDNRDDPDTPPGKPTRDLDFLYYGGIYRNVKLIVTPDIYLTDPMDQGVKRGGLETDVTLTENQADVTLTEHIKNTCPSSVSGEIFFELRDEKGVAAQALLPFFSQGKKDASVQAVLTVKNPHLWQPDDPHLYTLTTKMTAEGREDERITSLGLRSFSVNEEGFFVNGKKTMLFGLNRGQQYPYLGIAVSEEAHRREARMLKEAGINCLRLSHYPHSPAFLSECDRLGLLVIDPVPGWQFLGNEVWKKRLRENLRDMVRRDRNHPCVILFEVTPNETRWAEEEGDRFLHDLHLLVKEECPKALTGGDTVGRYSAVTAGFDVPYFGKDELSRLSPQYQDPRLTLKREYGDWGFGGNHSTSRVSRGDGEKAMQQQTWNFQFTHNDNLRQGGIIGDLIWEAIDHNRGYFPPSPISKSGIFDVFRAKKLSYCFVRSQKDAEKPEDYVLFLHALNWENHQKLVFYSNADRLELYGNDTLLSSQCPDHGKDLPFDMEEEKRINDNYWMTDENQVTESEKISWEAVHAKRCLYDGGNCVHMTHPPFTFEQPELSSFDRLLVKGYAKGQCVFEKTYLKQGKAEALEISAAEYQLPLVPNDNDFVFVYVTAVDQNGTPVTDFSEKVTLTVENGSCIGHNHINCEIGTACFMVKAKEKAASVTLTAVCGSMKSSRTLVCG